MLPQAAFTDLDLLKIDSLALPLKPQLNTQVWVIPAIICTRRDQEKIDLFSCSQFEILIKLGITNYAWTLCMGCSDMRSLNVIKYSVAASL
jgi:hypothetical protein